MKAVSGMNGYGFLTHFLIIPPLFSVIQIIQLVQIVQMKGDMMFLLDLTGKVPIFEQIQTQILRFIEAGVLRPGDRLPSVRQLAHDNGINPNTVAKAYSELEKNGYVYNLPKKGVYISEIDIQNTKTEKILAVLRPLKDSGIAKEEILHAADLLFGEDEHAEN